MIDDTKSHCITNRMTYFGFAEKKTSLECWCMLRRQNQKSKNVKLSLWHFILNSKKKRNWFDFYCVTKYQISNIFLHTHSKWCGGSEIINCCLFTTIYACFTIFTQTWKKQTRWHFWIGCIEMIYLLESIGSHISEWWNGTMRTYSKNGSCLQHIHIHIHTYKHQFHILYYSIDT